MPEPADPEAEVGKGSGAVRNNGENKTKISMGQTKKEHIQSDGQEIERIRGEAKRKWEKEKKSPLSWEGVKLV